MHCIRWKLAILLKRFADSGRKVPGTIGNKFFFVAAFFSPAPFRSGFFSASFFFSLFFCVFPFSFSFFQFGSAAANILPLPPAGFRPPPASHPSRSHHYVLVSKPQLPLVLAQDSFAALFSLAAHSNSLRLLGFRLCRRPPPVKRTIVFRFLGTKFECSCTKCDLMSLMVRLPHLHRPLGADSCRIQHKLPNFPEIERCEISFRAHTTKMCRTAAGSKCARTENVGICDNLSRFTWRAHIDRTGRFHVVVVGLEWRAVRNLCERPIKNCCAFSNITCWRHIIMKYYLCYVQFTRKMRACARA